jgi:hypothetical protein
MLFGLLRSHASRPPRRPHKPGRAPRRPWTLVRLEDRTVPTFTGPVLYATGAGPGGGAQVNVFDAHGGEFSFNAYPGFTGGVSVAVGDIDGDGKPDVITGPGPGGGPNVVVFSGADLELGRVTPIRSFNAYDASFRGGVFVAAGDANGDGIVDIITGAGPGGGPHVKAFSGAPLAIGQTTPTVLYSFLAYDGSFRGGVYVASADVGGDNGDITGHPVDEIVTGAGPGGGPHVKVFSRDINNPAALDTIASFLAYDGSFRGGVNVAAGIVTLNLDTFGQPIGPNNHVYADIVTVNGSGMNANVKVWRLDDGSNPSNFIFLPVANYTPFPAGFLGGGHIAVTAVPNDGIADIVLGAGQGGGAVINIGAGQALNNFPDTFPNNTPSTVLNAQVYPPGFLGGVFVG